MLAGHKGDQVWWWGEKGFVTWKDWAGKPPGAVARINAQAAALLAKPVAARLPVACTGRSIAVPIDGGSVGTLQPRSRETSAASASGPISTG